MKYYAIGDIHGRLDLLEKVVEKISGLVGEDDFRIITLGDYIDRGPQSREVIEFLMAHPEIIALQGNHEDIAVQSISCNLKPDWWMGNGGDKTMKSYGQRFMGGSYYYGADVYYSYVPDEHVKWMASLPLYYETDKQVFVHAGVYDRDAPLTEQQFDTKAGGDKNIQWMLYHPSDHGGWRGKHVVHGHHQFTDGPHVWNPGSDGLGGRTNLDVAAYRMGRIVIGVFDDSKGPAIEFIEVTDAEPSKDATVDSGKIKAVG